jgi:tight adherence protein C
MNELAVVLPVVVFVTVLLVGAATIAPGETTIQSRLRAYGYDLASQTGGDLRQPFWQRIVLPVGKGLGRALYRLTPSGQVASVQERLRQAGHPINLTVFLILRFVMGLLVPLLGLLYFLLQGPGVGLVAVVVLLFLAYFGFRLPDIWLMFKIDARRDRITRDLPDALDLVVVCVEAGCSLETAIAKVVESTHGPLAEEFAQMLEHVSLGRSRRVALHERAERCGSPDLQTFVAAITQADQMGVNIGTALRVQADAMRVRRRQRAEELIAKAPVKMLFPMIAFIFPALFVVIAGPAVIRIARFFSTMSPTLP